MPRFAVKSQLEHDGKKYAPGEFVNLTQEQASAMPWAVEAAPAQPIKSEESPKKGK